MIYYSLTPSSVVAMMVALAFIVVLDIGMPALFSSREKPRFLIAFIVFAICAMLFGILADLFASWGMGLIFGFTLGIILLLPLIRCSCRETDGDGRAAGRRLRLLLIDSASLAGMVFLLSMSVAPQMLISLVGAEPNAYVPWSMSLLLLGILIVASFSLFRKTPNHRTVVARHTGRRIVFAPAPVLPMTFLAHAQINAPPSPLS